MVNCIIVPQVHASTLIRKLIAGKPIESYISNLQGSWKNLAEAIKACPPNADQRTKAFEAAIADYPHKEAIRKMVFTADLGENLDNQRTSNWFEDYIDFSKRWSPRAYEGFHPASALFLLSTIASRRVSPHLGKQRFGFVLTVEEKIAFKQLAKLEGSSKAATLRRLLREEATRRGLWLSTSELVERWKNHSKEFSADESTPPIDKNRLGG